MRKQNNDQQDIQRTAAILKQYEIYCYRLEKAKRFTVKHSLKVFRESKEEQR